MQNACRWLLIIVMAANVVACVSDMSKPESQNDYDTDCDLANKVQHKVFSDPSLKQDPIVIKCYQGLVCITGKVASKQEQDHVLALVREVPGVLWVKDDLIIFPLQTT